MKPVQVAAGEYDARNLRAEYLASKHPFAAEVLRFYAQVAEFQKTLYSQAKTAKAFPASVQWTNVGLEPELDRTNVP